MAIVANLFIVAVAGWVIYRNAAKKKSLPHIVHTPYDDLISGLKGEDWSVDHYQEDTKHYNPYEQQIEEEPDRQDRLNIPRS